MDLRSSVLRRGTAIEYLSIAVACAEAIFSLLLGASSGSIALVGFGLDSVIEVISASAVVWRLARDPDAASREHAESIALRVVGWCFLALAAYVTVQSTVTLVNGHHPKRSLLGIVVLVFSFVAMVLLRRAKRAVAVQLGSDSMKADARQTEFCAYLSLIALAGVGLNAWAGWWWADPLAALTMVPIIVREGLEAARGEPCRHE